MEYDGTKGGPPLSLHAPGQGLERPTTNGHGLGPGFALGGGFGGMGGSSVDSNLFAPADGGGAGGGGGAVGGGSIGGGSIGGRSATGSHERFLRHAPSTAGRGYPITHVENTRQAVGKSRFFVGLLYVPFSILVTFAVNYSLLFHLSLIPLKGIPSDTYVTPFHVFLRHLCNLLPYTLLYILSHHTNVLSYRACYHLDWTLIGSDVPSHLEIKSVKKILKERAFLARQPFPLLQFPRLMVPLIAGDCPPVAIL